MMKNLISTVTVVVSLCTALITALPPIDTCERPPPWRRLTNRILSSIWSTSTHKSEERLGIDLRTGSSRSHSKSLAARYGEDIVLRFNVSTAEEANALAEASEDLYLDLWEFNDNWVDIRVAKDVVCASTASMVANCLYLARSHPSLVSCLPHFSMRMLHSCLVLPLPKSSPTLYRHQTNRPSPPNSNHPRAISSSPTIALSPSSNHGCAYLRRCSQVTPSSSALA
jgi:hypothetical protein